MSRISVFVAVCAMAALFACTQPKHADAQSAVAATAAHNCSLISAASRHRSSGLRTLSSAQTSKAQRYCLLIRKSASVLSFYQHRGRWAVAPRYHKWWLVPGAAYRQLVRKSRVVVQKHEQRLVLLSKRVQQLLPEPQIQHDWLYSALLCIHGGEGSWTAVSDTIPAYYGGLQMDYDFMRKYGSKYLNRWGTANYWPPAVQIEVAERAYRSGRGFYPWPNTAHACKLI